MGISPTILLFEATKLIMKWGIITFLVKWIIFRSPNHLIYNQWNCTNRIIFWSYWIDVGGYRGLRKCHLWWWLWLMMWTQIYQDHTPNPWLSPCKMKLQVPCPSHPTNRSAHPQCQRLREKLSWLQRGFRLQPNRNNKNTHKLSQSMEIVFLQIKKENKDAAKTYNLCWNVNMV